MFFFFFCLAGVGGFFFLRINGTNEFHWSFCCFFFFSFSLISRECGWVASSDHLFYSFSSLHTITFIFFGGGEGFAWVHQLCRLVLRSISAHVFFSFLHRFVFGWRLRSGIPEIVLSGSLSLLFLEVFISHRVSECFFFRYGVREIKYLAYSNSPGSLRDQHDRYGVVGGNGNPQMHG